MLDYIINIIVLRSLSINMLEGCHRCHEIQKQLQRSQGAFTRYEGSLGDTIESDKKQHQQDETSPPERV